MADPPRFDAKWQRRRRWRARWNALRWWFLVAALIAVGAWLGLMPERTPRDAGTVERRFTLCGARGGGAACVPDGDTIVFGGGENRRRVRLAGFDAPEMDGACEAERHKAQEARGALLDWLNAGPFQWDGGDDPPYDRYGRELRSAWRDDAKGNRDWLADHMTGRGLASGSGWTAQAIDWCANPR